MRTVGERLVDALRAGDITRPNGVSVEDRLRKDPTLLDGFSTRTSRLYAWIRGRFLRRGWPYSSIIQIVPATS